VLAFVKASWEYWLFVAPLVGLSIGLGLANGPASSGSTAAVPDDQVGQASGISNMARYIGGSVAVAAAAMINNAVANNHLADGAGKPAALAAGLAAASLMMAIWCACGIGLVAFLRRHHARAPEAIDLAAAATASLHTIPIQRSGHAG